VVGIITCILIYLGCFISSGRKSICYILAIVQTSYFTLLQFDQLPLTYLGLKYLKYSNGYNLNLNSAITAEFTTA
jgi:hypothetical protein